MKTKQTAQTLSTYTFHRAFPDEKAAVSFIESIRWDGKPVCPKCGGASTSPRPKRHGHRCKSCRVDFTVRIGTIFEGSNAKMHQWLYAIYLLQTARKGISSLQLSKEIGLCQKSSWFMLHRLRESCGISAEKLNGVVEVDETYLGGKESNKHASRKLRQGRGTIGKTAIIGARKRGGKTIAKVLKNTKTESLHGFIEDTIESGSEVITDEHAGYNHLRDYAHASVRHSAKEFVNGMAHTNGIESVWAVLKRGYNGVYHNWSVKHTQKYINEFAFRLNDGNCKVDTIDRIAAVIRGSIGKRLKYKELTQ